VVVLVMSVCWIRGRMIGVLIVAVIKSSVVALVNVVGSLVLWFSCCVGSFGEGGGMVCSVVVVIIMVLRSCSRELLIAS